MQNFEENLASRVNGSLQPLLGVSVTVKTALGLLATIYSDNGATTQGNPMTTDANGRFGFYAANGDYVLTFSGPQIQTYERPIDLYDPDDAQPLTQAQAALPSAASRFGFQADGDGAQGRTVENKLRETVSVKDFGAVGNGVADDADAFQKAVNSLPANGGYIDVPDGAYLISVAPSVGTKSIEWDIGTGSVFTGAGAATFPRMATNPAQIAVGPYIRSQSREASPTGGGIAAWNVEMIQPADYVGQSVAAFFGASGSSTNPASNVWTLNPLIRANAGAAGTYQCLEIDVDCFSTAALVKGISLNGAGPENPDMALEIIRTGISRWARGIDINHSIDAIRVRTDGLVRAFVVGDVAGFVNTILSGRQLANGADSIVVQRTTDTSPAGFLYRAVNAANTDTLFSVDAAGQVFGTGATVKADQSGGFAALVMENSSTASVTTKTVTTQARGRDTANGLKVIGEFVMTPSNSNLIASSYTVRTRTADAMLDSWQIDTSGNALVMRLGSGLRVKEGSNAKQGTATLSGGTVVVANTSVTANSRIFLTSQFDGGTPGYLRVTARVPGTSFTVTSGSASDASTFAYQIFEPA